MRIIVVFVIITYNNNHHVIIVSNHNLWYFVHFMRVCVYVFVSFICMFSCKKKCIFGKWEREKTNARSKYVHCKYVWMYHMYVSFWFMLKNVVYICEYVHKKKKEKYHVLLINSLFIPKSLSVQAFLCRIYI